MRRSASLGPSQLPPPSLSLILLTWILSTVTPFPSEEGADASSRPSHWLPPTWFLMMLKAAREEGRKGR